MSIAQHTIYQIDAFSPEPFKGNPAGVMLVDDAVSEHWMQQMAAEMNLSETAYLLPQENGYAIRYFTPEVEIPLCGHATLASAHLLFESGVKKHNETIRFFSKAGVLDVTKEEDWIVMDFPAYSLQSVAIPQELTELIGFQPIECYSSNYDWLVVVASSEQQVKLARPDFAQMKAKGFGHVMITATSQEVDYVVRCFAPSAGINEDPVTGSAQCALTPLWHLKTGKNTFESIQCSRRTGHLKTEYKGNRVLIKGQCCIVFHATLQMP